ncbi:alcohol dehydrogenase 1-like isoform X3 [Poeciliopsis prolifica]|uniref:alcohol dehydrogenase 1-like isoform X3 n=1 Tax=Poeciliopsis prolifica TaxID=188132 RepID=UPI0024132797|nr:alcohol dehydrogenase 1-like isoform X3 [Poeciliopsis prolifica]
MSTAGQVIRCRAAVCWAPDTPAAIEEIEVAPPEAGEVRIKIVATSLCHSDLYHLLESKAADGFPTVLGHEGAGVVESVGPGVTEFQPGDKVIPLFLCQCKECRFCQSPRTNQCERAWTRIRQEIMAGVESRFTCKGKRVHQLMGTSTFSEYTVVNQIAVTRIDPAAPLDKVCLLGCGICTGYGAAVNTAKSQVAEVGITVFRVSEVLVCPGGGGLQLRRVRPGSRGPGCSHGLQGGRSQKDHRCRRQPGQSGQGQRVGRHRLPEPQRPEPAHPGGDLWDDRGRGGLLPGVRGERGGHGEVMRSALEASMEAWGVSVVVGWTDMFDITIRPRHLICGRTWKGSMFGGFKAKDGVAGMVRAYLEKKVKLDEFITHNMALDQVNDAIELMRNSQWVRQETCTKTKRHHPARGNRHRFPV